MSRVRVLSIVVLGSLIGFCSVTSAHALRAIHALEARTRDHHERMLEDTQSLADQNDSLVQENAERIAEIAALQADITALRAAMAARQGPRQ